MLGDGGSKRPVHLLCREASWLAGASQFMLHLHSLFLGEERCCLLPVGSLGCAVLPGMEVTEKDFGFVTTQAGSWPMKLVFRGNGLTGW